MSVRMWMQRSAVPGGHSEHMATRRHRRPAPPTNAPVAARGMPVPALLSRTDALHRLRACTVASDMPRSSY